MDFDEDEYQGDVIGEYTPNTLINDYVSYYFIRLLFDEMIMVENFHISEHGHMK